MNAIYFTAGYVALTALFWLGNRNVPRKKPRNSAAKWLVWTTTWISFSVMTLALPADQLDLEGLLGPALVSPFAYPMLFSLPLPLAAKALFAVAPPLAAWLGYTLARRHNDERDSVAPTKKDSAR